MNLRFLRKTTYIILLSVLLILSIALFFLSTFTRTWIEKNSMKLIGRKITLKELHFNYFRCSVRAEGIVMFEKNNSENFVSLDELYVNFEPLRLIKKEINFSEIKILHPVAHIIYNKSFNFDDLMKSGNKPKEKNKKENSVTKYVIRNFGISQGYIMYSDLSAKTSQEIKTLDLNLPYISWDSKQSKVGIDFILGKSGKVFISGLINQETSKYLVKLKTENIEISPFTNYLKSYLDVSVLSGKLYSDLAINGDMSKPSDVIVSGKVNIKNAEIKDKDNKVVFSAENVSTEITSLDIASSDYRFVNIRLDSPHLLAIRYKDKTNIEQILAPYFADTLPSADTTKLRYSIRNIQINNGDVLFSDMTLKRQFDLAIGDLNFTMDDFSESADRIPVKFSMKLNKTGSFEGTAIWSMINFKNVEFLGTIANFEMISFSPYSEYYLSRPLIKGKMNYKCKLKMNPAKLENLNNIRLVNPKFGKKNKKDSIRYKVPVNLALYILKDSKGIVSIELPVEGKPSDPSFKLKKIIWKTLEKFLLRCIASPFVAMGKIAGDNPDKIKTIPFSLLQDSLSPEQKQRLDKLAEIMLKKQDLAFTFTQTTNLDKEKELLAVNEVKYKYISQNMQGINDKALIRKNIATLNDNDVSFMKFLKLSVPDTTKTLNERCETMLGSEKLNLLFSQLLQEREKLISDYLLAKSVPQQSILVKTADLKNLPEVLKVPQFTVDISMP